MPQVPSSQGPRVAQGVMPDARLNATGLSAIPSVQLSTPQLQTRGINTPQLRIGKVERTLDDPNSVRSIRMSDGGGAQMAEMGGALVGLSETMYRAAMAQQVKVNATVVDDALDQARQKALHLTYGSKNEATGQITGGYRQLTGEQAIRRDSGKSLDEEVHGDFDEFVKGLSKDKLTNADQRRVFEEQVRSVAGQLRQGASTWQAEQFDAYQSAVYASAVENQTANFSMVDPTDLASQNKALDEIDQAVATQGINKGAPEAAITVGQRAARSKAVAGLFEQAMASKNYMQATAILNTHAERIDANTATKMRLTLDGKVSIQMGEQLADAAWDTWAKPAFNGPSTGGVTETKRAFNIVIRTENRGEGKQAVDGKLIVSPKGAYGVAQLMPDTAKETIDKHPDLLKLAGVKNAKELLDLTRDPSAHGEAANRLVGEMAFNDLVLRFKGDTTKAMAAYNAGPGWLVGGKDTKGNKIEGALNIAARTGTDWRDHLPQETKEYLAYASKQFTTNATAGIPKKPSKSDLYQRIDARTDDPDMRRAAYARVDRLYSAAEEDERTGYETAYLTGIDTVRKAGGDINAIPPALRSSIRPDQLSQVEDYAAKLRKGEPVKTDAATYFGASDPNWLKRATVEQVMSLRPKLADEDFERITKQWHDAHNPTPGKGPDALDAATVDHIVDSRLQAAGVDTSPGEKDEAGRARMGAIRAFTHGYVLDYQKQTAAKLEDYGKLEELLNRMFTRDQRWTSGTFLGVGGGAKTTNVLTAGTKDIPRPTRERLASAFEKQKGRKPEDGELLEIYYRDQLYSGR